MDRDIGKEIVISVLMICDELIWRVSKVLKSMQRAVIASYVSCVNRVRNELPPGRKTG